MNIKSTLNGYFRRLLVAFVAVLATSSAWAQTSHNEFTQHRDFSSRSTARWIEPGDAYALEDEVSQDEEVTYEYFKEIPATAIRTAAPALSNPVPAKTNTVPAKLAELSNEEIDRAKFLGIQSPRLPTKAASYRFVSDARANEDVESFVPCEDFPYLWTVRADTIFLNRSTADGRQSLAFGNPADPVGTEVLNTSDLDLSTAWGPRISVIKDFACCSKSIEFSYFGIESWDAVQQRAGAISVQFPSLAHPPLPPGPAGAVTFRYGSDLHNTEINLRHNADDGWLSLILGFRYLELGEEFGAVFNTGGATSLYNINTNNHLVGFQAGAEADLWQRGEWAISGWAKAAVFSNSADQSTFQNLAATGGGTTSVGARGNETAYLGELGLNVLFQLTDRLAARAGYQVLWMDRLALAPEQLDNTNPAIPLAALDHNGDLLLHGGFFGLEGVF